MKQERCKAYTLFLHVLDNSKRSVCNKIVLYLAYSVNYMHNCTCTLSYLVTEGCLLLVFHQCQLYSLMQSLL